VNLGIFIEADVEIDVLGGNKWKEFF
jgi:hypothetical protein